VFIARYALSPYIKQIRFVFKGLMLHRDMTAVCSEIHTHHTTTQHNTTQYLQMHLIFITLTSITIVAAAGPPDMAAGCRVPDITCGCEVYTTVVQRLLTGKQGNSSDTSVRWDTQWGGVLICGRSVSALGKAPRSLPVFYENKLRKCWFITTALHIYRFGFIVSAWCIHCVESIWGRIQKLSRMKYDVSLL
jgi:hypothetical protein